MATFWDNPDGYFKAGAGAATPWPLRLGGITAPGYAEVTVAPSFSVDKGKAAGANGARLTFHGREPADVQIRIYLGHPDDQEAWIEMLARIWPPSRRRDPIAIDISHGSLEGLGVKSIAIISVSNLQPGRVAGEMAVSIRAIEWVKPEKKKATKTVQASEVKVRPEFDQNYSTPTGASVLIGPDNAPVRPSTVTPPPR